MVIWLRAPTEQSAQTIVVARLKLDDCHSPPLMLRHVSAEAPSYYAPCGDGGSGHLGRPKSGAYCVFMVYLLRLGSTVLRATEPSWCFTSLVPASIASLAGNDASDLQV